MDFIVSKDHSVLDLLNFIKNSRKKNIKIFLSDSFRNFDNAKNINLFKKACLTFRKSVTLYIQNPDLYKRAVSYELKSVLVEGTNQEISRHLNLNYLRGESDDSDGTLRVTPSKRGFLLIILATVLGILIISFQFSYASIRIWPNLINKTLSVKFEMCDENCLSKDRSSTYITFPHSIEKSYEFISTGQKFAGTSSEGTATFYNLYPQDTDLRKNTRIQTDDGLVFISKKTVHIPGSVYQGEKKVPGSAEVPIVSSNYDAFGQIIGSRGNIESAILFLPGLPETDRGNIWAQIKKPLKGGTSLSTSLVTQKDVDSFMTYVKEDIIKQALDNVSKEIPSHYPDYILTPSFSEFFPITITSDNIPKLNESVKSKKISVQANLTLFLLPIKDIISKLTDIITSKLIDKQEILESLSDADIQFFSITPVPEHPGHFLTDISVPYFIKRILTLSEEDSNTLNNKIAGTKSEQAVKIIFEKFKQVKVKINSWPPWQNSLPFDPGQIGIKIIN